MVLISRKPRKAGRVRAVVALIAAAAMLAVISIPVGQAYASAGVGATQAAKPTEVQAVAVITRVCQGYVCMNLTRTGNKIFSASLECTSGGQCPGGGYATFEYHGYRTITGGDAVQVGPQRSLYKQCALVYCQHEFTGINWTYYCGQWVYGRITYHGVIKGTPVYRFPC